MMDFVINFEYFGKVRSLKIPKEDVLEWINTLTLEEKLFFHMGINIENDKLADKKTIAVKSMDDLIDNLNINSYGTLASYLRSKIVVLEEKNKIKL